MSNANDDFPEPETHVIVMILFLGKLTSISFRLCVLTHCRTIRSSRIAISVFLFLNIDENRQKQNSLTYIQENKNYK
ncbi:MAG: hypothetical protein Q8O99_04830 [bacterium]|nr:hypothetical protein [bacterium]